MAKTGSRVNPCREWDILNGKRQWDPFWSLPQYYMDVLKKKWPDGDRLKVAMNLSPTPEVCADLLSGRYVDPARLDPEWLRWAKREQFVALKPALECVC